MCDALYVCDSVSVAFVAFTYVTYAMTSVSLGA